MQPSQGTHRGRLEAINPVELRACYELPTRMLNLWGLSGISVLLPSGPLNSGFSCEFITASSKFHAEYEVVLTVPLEVDTYEEAQRLVAPGCHQPTRRSAA